MARILVIDDSATVIHFVRSALSEDGHVVSSLESFIHLAGVIRGDAPDLVLLDLNIPALSGLSMGNLVRKYEQRSIPIVIYSSRPAGEMQLAARELRAVSVLRKGSDPNELRNAVNGALMTQAASDAS